MEHDGLLSIYWASAAAQHGLQWVATTGPRDAEVARPLGRERGLALRAMR